MDASRCSRALAVSLLGLFLARPARAAGVVAFAKPGNGQAGMVVGFDSVGVLRATSCPTATCALQGGTEVAYPPELRTAVAGAALAVVGIGDERRAVVVTLKGAGGLTWQALLVAPLSGGAPELIFSGVTGYAEGADGTRRGKRLEISEPDATGARTILVGDISEDLSLCGRPAILSPKLLATSDLKLHSAKVQRLSLAEREQARAVTATRTSREQPARAGGLLHARVASSAVGLPGSLTDGDPDTSWAENTSGAGKGEFVLLSAPSTLPIVGVELTIRGPHAAPPHGVAPREFWLASTHDLVKVTMPEDAWQHPGESYSVALEPPFSGNCLALVTETAFNDTPLAQVTFSELRAVTQFDSMAPAELAAALAGGGERAEAAAAVLGTQGAPGFEATASVFPKLDEGGRRVALGVIDLAPCETSVPVYLTALQGSVRAQSDHARDHIRRCGPQAAPWLAKAASSSTGGAQLDLLAELTLADPVLAIDTLTPLLGARSAALRAALRTLFARAARAPAAASHVRSTLGNTALGEQATIEVLRALGDSVSTFQPEAANALARWATPSASARTRYLLIEPSSVLSRTDPRLKADLAQMLTSAGDPHLRTQVAATLKGPEGFEPELVRALSDPAPRVREAAARAFGRGNPASATAALAALVAKDQWPFVRIAAIDALAVVPQASESRTSIARALADESATVRAHVLLALGVLRDQSELPKIRARLTAEDELPLVRAAAAQVLGELCDNASLDELTRHATKLADPMADANQREIAAGALVALGKLAPSDLDKRLAPLLSQNAPAPARRAARAMVAHNRAGSCGRASLRPAG
jgi:hypothetical protein